MSASQGAFALSRVDSPQLGFSNHIPRLSLHRAYSPRVKKYPIRWRAVKFRGSALLVGDAKEFYCAGASGWDIKQSPTTSLPRWQLASLMYGQDHTSEKTLHSLHALLEVVVDIDDKFFRFIAQNRVENQKRFSASYCNFLWQLPCWMTLRNAEKIRISTGNCITLLLSALSSEHL